MNIAQGLKEKNRIAGRIAELEKKIVKSNRYQSNRPPVEKANILFASLHAEKQNLVAIKARLAIANGGIAKELAELAETKGLIKFLEGLQTGVSGYTVQVHDYNTNKLVDSNYTIEYDLDEAYVNELLEETKKLANQLQDTIDNYNATTSI
jgi:hypothetical protein